VSKGKLAIIAIVVLAISMVGMIYGASHSPSKLEPSSQKIGVEGVAGKHFDLELTENVNVNSTP
jgi:hypothetical protein